MFDWDRNNLRKIRTHQITREEVEEALLNDPVPIYDQEADEELRYLYYGESNAGRMLAIVFTERDSRIRMVTAYDLDAGQKRDYLEMRLQGE